MYGRYRKVELPRVIHISVARYKQELPQPGEALEFLVSLHEEGTGFTWQQNVKVDPKTEAFLIAATHDLHLWSLNAALTPKKVTDLVCQLGASLYKTFIGAEGDKVLSSIPPTAVLLDVDETIMNLPWELIAMSGGPVSERTPFGRLVTTRILPQTGRDPKQEDSVVRILAVANPTLDLPATEKVLAELESLEGQHMDFSIDVDVLAQENATRKGFTKMLTGSDYDILHFAGHAFLDPNEPGSSALRFADGDLTANDILKLPWGKPPYFVFNSACESGRAVGGQRLVSAKSQSNGLAAAFLACGVYGYAGYFWPVTDAGAGIFARTFYRSLFERQNVGLAFLDARREAISELWDFSDLTGFSAILYGDAASQHRRDMAMAA
ncbi:MAG: CHAT domain-containing protein [Anaerolineales bacterium]|nr:CHAT domain-containing protein [Anaerolineales bacterium]